MSARTLITGSTGFVGSHVAQAFVEAGHQVRCGVRATSDLRWIAGLNAQRVPLDLTRPEDLREAVKGVEVIVHAAGITRARRPTDYYTVNSEGTRNLAAAAADAGVRRFVLIGSLAARGPDGREGPASHYGRSKLQAEASLRAFEGRMEVVVLRPAAVYGPRDTDFLPMFRMARSGWLPIPPGPRLLQPVYASDVARAALAAASRSAGFGPFPVAEAGRHAWREVVKGLEQALGRRVRAVPLPAAVFKLAGRASGWTAGVRGSAPIFDERRAEDVAIHGWTCDTSGTERALGWRAEVPLYDGLKRTVRWYREWGWIRP